MSCILLVLPFARVMIATDDVAFFVLFQVILYVFLLEEPAALANGNTACTANGMGKDKSKGVTKVTEATEAPSFGDIVMLPSIINLGGAYFMIKLVRYTLMFWLPFYLMDWLNYSAGSAALVSSLFDLGGVVGSVGGGFLADKVFPGKRATVLACLCLCTGAAVAVYVQICTLGLVTNAIAIAIMGALVAGPDSALGGAATQDLCVRSGLASNPAACTTARWECVLCRFVRAWSKIPSRQLLRCWSEWNLYLTILFLELS
eukprot:m.65997 g.65997  ORF g.65997 m.65997 type:complete len:260 (-) comp13705_c0_seq2:47-826(-)